jgi:hypothetical protein
LTQYKNLGNDCRVFSTGITDQNNLLWATMGGDVCTTGCPWYNKGTCKGFRRLQGNFTLAYTGPERQQANTLMNRMVVETTKEEAARLSISVSEVRRRRKGGT